MEERESKRQKVESISELAVYVVIVRTVPSLLSILVQLSTIFAPLQELVIDLFIEELHQIQGCTTLKVDYWTRDMLKSYPYTLLINWKSPTLRELLLQLFRLKHDRNTFVHTMEEDDLFTSAIAKNDKDIYLFIIWRRKCRYRMSRNAVRHSSLRQEPDIPVIWKFPKDCICYADLACVTSSLFKKIILLAETEEDFGLLNLFLANCPQICSKYASLLKEPGFPYNFILHPVEPNESPFSCTPSVEWADPKVTAPYHNFDELTATRIFGKGALDRDQIRGEHRVVNTFPIAIPCHAKIPKYTDDLFLWEASKGTRTALFCFGNHKMKDDRYCDYMMIPPALIPIIAKKTNPTIDWVVLGRALNGPPSSSHSYSDDDSDESE